MRYLHIVAGVAVNALKIEDPAKFPQWTIVQSDTAEVGDLWDGQAFTRPAVDPAIAQERERLAEIDQTLESDAVLASIRAMTKAQYDTFWTNRTAAQKDQILKYLLLAEARRP